MPNFKPEKINMADYTNIFGLSKRTPYEWIRLGKFEKFVVMPEKIHGKWMFSVQEVEKVLGRELRPIE